MPIKFFLLGGGLGFLRRGGVEVQILFLWAWGFFRSEFCRGGNSDHGLSFLFSTDLQYF